MKLSWLLKFFDVKLPLQFPDGEVGPVGGAGDTDSSIMDDGEDDKVDNDNNADDGDKEENTDKEDDKEDDTDKEDGDKEDTDDDEKDDKKKDEDKEDDELDDKETERLTSYTDIKKAYPEFFRKFPDIRAALFRDEQYGALFANPEEAQAVTNKASTFDRISNDLVAQGNFEPLFDTISKNNDKSFEKIAFGLLPYMAEKHEKLYLEMASLPIKQLLRSAYRAGKDTDLGRAAQHIHKYFFDNLNLDEKVKAETGRVEVKSAKEKELEDKLNSINDREQKAFNTSIDTSYLTRMKRDIVSSLEQDERITPYMMNKLTDDILLDIRGQLDKDTRYVTTMRSLFSQARVNGLNDSFKTRIISTSLARAKALIAATRTRLVSEALKAKAKAKGKDSRDSKDKEDKKPSFVARDHNRDERDRRPSGNGNNGGSKKPLTDLDILRGR